MTYLKHIDWTFSNTAEAATGIMLAAAVLLAIVL